MRSYGVAGCLCGVMLYTEASFGVGLLWTLATCCGGCAFALVWGALQLQRHGSLALAGDTEPRPPGAPRPAAATLGMLFYPLYAVSFVVFFVVTWINQPLFPLKTQDLSWCLWWLMTTCFDYYGCCFLYVGVIVSTEPSPAVALAWTLGALFVGTPACCAWVVRRLLQHGTLCLAAAVEGKGDGATAGYTRSS